MKALEKIVEAKENMNIGYIEWANDCIDEAIAELKALQPRSCEGCKYEVKYYECIACSNNFTCSRQIFTDRYEPKDNQ